MAEKEPTCSLAAQCCRPGVVGLTLVTEDSTVHFHLDVAEAHALKAELTRVIAEAVGRIAEVTGVRH